MNETNITSEIAAETSGSFLPIVTGILLIILIIIIAWIIMRKIKQKKRMSNAMPQEVLAEFNKAEQMLKDSKGTMTPQEVLWKLYQERGNIIIPEKENIIYGEAVSEIKPKSKINLRNIFRRRT